MKVKTPEEQIHKCVYSTGNIEHIFSKNNNTDDSYICISLSCSNQSNTIQENVKFIDWSRIHVDKNGFSNKVSTMELQWKPNSSYSNWSNSIRATSNSSNSTNEESVIIEFLKFCHKERQKQNNMNNKSKDTSYSKDIKLFVNYLWDFPHVEIKKFHKHIRKYRPDARNKSTPEIDALLSRATKDDLKEVLRPSEYLHIMPYVKNEPTERIPSYMILAKI